MMLTVTTFGDPTTTWLWPASIVKVNVSVFSIALSLLMVTVTQASAIPDPKENVGGRTKSVPLVASTSVGVTAAT